jgi:hypothetical protein
MSSFQQVVNEAWFEHVPHAWALSCAWSEHVPHVWALSCASTQTLHLPVLLLFAFWCFSLWGFWAVVSFSTSP